MKIDFKSYLKETVNPFHSHELRMSKKYKPRYRSGLIAIRFQDDDYFNRLKKDPESKRSRRYDEVDDKGEYAVNYHDLFNNNRSDFIKYFETKYKIQMSKYRNGTDDYYHYFKCEPGKEKEKLEEISKDKIVKGVDFVDVRNLESKDELQIIIDDLVDLESEFSEYSDEEIDNIISDVINRLQNL